MSIKLKIITVMLITVLVLTISASVSYASSVPSIDEMGSQARNFINAGKQNDKLSPDKIADIVKPIATILLAIGAVVVVVAGAVMGIKYMTASPEQQAKLKKQLVGLVIATIVIFGAYGIWSITYNFMTEVVETEGITII